MIAWIRHSISTMVPVIPRMPGLFKSCPANAVFPVTLSVPGFWLLNWPAGLQWLRALLCNTLTAHSVNNQHRGHSISPCNYILTNQSVGTLILEKCRPVLAWHAAFCTDILVGRASVITLDDISMPAFVRYIQHGNAAFFHQHGADIFFEKLLHSFTSLSPWYWFPDCHIFYNRFSEV